jgi:pimeloyl-ACP methyl ester carboxylesterase
MKLNSFVLAGLACAALLSATTSFAQDSAAPSAPIKNVVLVHGLFADGSSWQKVIPLLQAKGLHVTAVQNPTTSLDADVDAVKRVRRDGDQSGWR